MAALLILAVIGSSWLVLRADVPQVASGTWVAAGDVGTIPTGAASVALPDGRVLVAGGQSNGTFSTGISTYNPAAGTWAAAGDLTVARSGHAATVLKDGRVLIAGGTTSSGPSFDIEIYDPSSGTSVRAGAMTLPRADHAAATLKDGRVLIVGGSDGVSPLSVAEIFDPATGQGAAIAAAMSAARVKATATTMLDGHVLVVGGSDGTNDLSSAEIFDPADGSFFATGAMQAGRSGHTAVLLPNNNQVLIAGGMSAGAAVASAELYADWRNGFSTTPSPMSTTRAGAIAGGLKPYDLAFVGGGGNTTGEYYGYATVKTDKNDYQPGEIVTITGRGWQPGETVTLKVTEDADTHFDWNLTAVADAQGNIINQDFYPRQDAQFQHLGMRFYVLAAGAASQAVTTFTDGSLKIKSVAWPGSASPRTFDVTIQPFTGSLNCTTGGGAIAPGTADGNGLNTGNIGAGDSWQIVANATANAPNASFTFSSWTNPDSLDISPNLTSRTICVVGFKSGVKDLIGNYVANAVPVANNDTYTTNEDSPLTVASPGVLANDTDANGNTLTAVRSAGSSGPNSGTLTLNANGSFTYTPTADFNGTDSFTYKANDGFVDSTTFATVTITVTSVNDAPTFTKGADQTVFEDAGAQSVPSWATGISAGPANENAQTLTFSATNTNNSLFSAQPSVAPNGTLTYIPAPNANGSATVTVRLTDDGGIANGGVNFSEQTFTIAVTAVNDAPGFTKGADQTVIEDAGAQTVTAWATAISTGPADESSQTASFQITGNTNASLFSSAPAVAANGTLTYTPAANANGTATITIVVKDDGGIANGGVDQSAPQTFVLNVTAVNDAPTFVKGADQTVLEDAAAQTVAGWATSISAGPANESAQILTFSATNTNNPLFSLQPSIAANGTLTYTPAANANGSATVTVHLEDDGGTADGGVNSSERTFTITVTPVNDAPSFAKGADQTVLEDAGAQSVPSWATSISAGPANESGQAVSFQVTNNTNPSLFSGAPAVGNNGTLTYTPAAGANGTATITIVAKDNGGTDNGGVDTSAGQTFVLNVTAVNDAPTFTKGADQTVLEDAAAQSVAWATAMSPGPANESSQTLTFSATNSNNGLFSGQPAVAADGTLTYTPAANAFGSATVTVRLQDNGGTDNAGVDFSEQTFTITVRPVNDAPSFVKGADQTVLEDAGAQTVPWATSISSGPANESGQAVSFQVTNNTNPGLFSTAPAVAADGTLIYTPAANENGSATITIQAKDNGGTDNGGVDTSAGQTFVLNVTAVNDAPTFVKGADQTVLEDAAAQSVAWATNMSAGPTDESGQTLTFSTTNSNNALFSVQPAVAADGTLTYTPAANAYGTATVTVRLTDNGGTANGAVDFTEQTFTITVTPVNDAPSFVKGSDQTVLEDAGAQTVSAWATAISPGPNESSQTVSFQITNNLNPGLFSVAPAVAPDGTLTYTPAANANGSATITIHTKDDGGTTNGGADTSDPQTFVLNVTAVNDTPSFTKGADDTVLEDSGARTVANWATNLSAGPANESAQTLTFSTTNTNTALFSVQPSVADGTGTLTYTPAPNAYGTATVTVRLTDNGGTDNGGDDHSEQTFTITVAAVNDAPRDVLAATAPGTINENQTATVSGSFTDPDNGDTHTVTIVWSDGSANTVIALPAAVFTYSAVHQYLDDNPTATALDTYAVGVTVADNGTPPLSGAAGSNVTVRNVAPAISSVTGPTGPQPLGSIVSVTGTFTDQGTQDTHSCTVTWDDGSTTAGTVSEANGSGSCTASHVYAGPGVYSIVMTVKDDDAGTFSRPMETEFAVIFDPNGGFVTGGGWIMSPAGASVAYPTATGKANFGFVSKYKKGSNIPEGQTEFQFKAGDLNFHSSAYDLGSLVISAAKAQYKGTGDINGVGGYQFVLTAYDGQGPGGGGVDRFRMKITRNGAVVYDNRMGASDDLDQADPTALSGGSIAIHK